MLCSGKEFIPSPFRDRNFVASAPTKDTDHPGSGLIFKGTGDSSSVSIARSVAGSALN